MNNRVMATIPDGRDQFMNIMQQYYSQLLQENPNVLYKYKLRQIEMPTRNNMKRMSEIYKTKQALKKTNGPGKTKNNAILLF